MQLVWFRQDLRLQDHTALWHARQSGPTVAFIALSPQQWALHDDAAIKIDCYLRQLHILRQQLDTLNIPLIIQHIPLWSGIAHALGEICMELKIKQVHAHVELGVNELRRDAQVQQQLEQQGISVQLYHDRTLFPVGSIRNQSNKPYQVFGAFKKSCYERLSISIPSCYPAIDAQTALAKHALWQTPFTLDDFYSAKISTEQQTLWPMSEAHAQHCLDEFMAHGLTHYADERDFPALNSTSRIGLYLNLGILSIRQCLQALFREQNGYFHLEGKGQQTWLDELLWREFYQHILFDFPRVSKHQPFQIKTARIAWRDAPQDLEAWQQGQTGIPIVDAGMRQLLATGWMHNRVRMICAMFLSKNLLIDWRLGEQWFMQHLVDGDLAANNGGWQWCASTGTDAVPYFRIFNPISQSQKFDAHGDYLRQWLPELAHLDAKQIHEPYAKNLQLDLNYPKPIVDLKQSRLRAIEIFKALG